MTELIPVSVENINGEPVQTVDARNLHEFLESKQQFANWIEKRIKEYGFEEGREFLINLLKNPSATRGRPTKEYHLTIDMGKELAMVERNEKGRQVRKYFIECERKYKESLYEQLKREAPEKIEVDRSEYIGLLKDHNDVLKDYSDLLKEKMGAFQEGRAYSRYSLNARKHRHKEYPPNVRDNPLSRQFIKAGFVSVPDFKEKTGCPLAAETIGAALWRGKKIRPYSLMILCKYLGFAKDDIRQMLIDAGAGELAALL